MGYEDVARADGYYYTKIVVKHLCAVDDHIEGVVMWSNCYSGGQLAKQKVCSDIRLKI